jgi:transcriptional regulator with XRE-family HTH domain
MYGDFVRRVRESAGLTQEELATTTGTSQPTLSAYEHDRRVPSADTLNRILVACGYQLAAVAGTHQVRCPLPRGRWFEDDDLPEPDGLDEALAAAEERGRMRADANSEDRAVVIDNVLSLASDQLGARRRR